MIDFVKVSKFLSLVLRHQPQKIGLTLDESGWANIGELIHLANLQDAGLTRELIERIVAQSDKQRFAISDDGLRIRANQGHSIEVHLDLPAMEPPEALYHGTATRFVNSIKAQGLIPGSRQHVHLSLEAATATKVGQRHGQPAILIVHAREMWEAGHTFYLSANGVWLTAHVPTAYITFPD